MKNILPIKNIVKQAVKTVCLFSFMLVMSVATFAQEVSLNKTVTQKDQCNQFDVELSITGQPVQRPIEAVLVIDQSGSMGTTYLNHAKNAAKEFARKFLIDEYVTGNKISIVSYSYSGKLEIALSSNYTNVESAINRLEADGFTNIADGIDVAAQELYNHGTFNCNTIRSIVLLTDGVANRAPSYYNCNYCDREPTSKTCCTRAAETSGQNSHTIRGYSTKFFSVGLFGGINNQYVQNIAETTIDEAQNSGFWSTESSADLSGIYNEISNQLIWAAKNAVITETVNSGYSIVSGSITNSKGTTSVNGQNLTWNLDYLYEETSTLKYTIEANDGTCGSGTPTTGTISYENSSCSTSNANFTNPEICVPCVEIESIALEQAASCSCDINYSAVFNSLSECTDGTESYAWQFYLDGQNIGSSTNASGTFTIPGGNCRENSGKTIKSELTVVHNNTDGCTLSKSSSKEYTIPECCDIEIFDHVDTFFCDEYILPEIQGNNLTGNQVYRTEPFGAGEVLPVGSAITSTQTIYMYDETGTEPNCFDQKGFVIEIYYSPDVTAINNVIACDSYTLPEIPGSNLSGSQAYYTEENAQGTKYEIGDVITSSMTLWAYDRTGILMENCDDQESFTITITNSPNINDIQDQVTCDSYTLPTINGTNLSGNQAYYTETNGGGTKYLAGETINSSTTLFIYDETGTTPNCSDEESFSITINNTPDIDGISTQTACRYFIFPEITGTNLTGNESYYSEANGGGTPYSKGDTIWNNVTMYIYDETGTTPNCFDQERFDIRIDNLAEVTLDPEGPICDEYTSGISLNGQPGGGTYSGTAVTGNTFYPQNAVIGSNEVIYTVSSGTCSGADTINITVVETPEVNDKQDVASCDFYVFQEITGTNLSGNEAFFTASNGAGSSYNEGDTIWSTTRLYIYDETETDPACSSEENFLITINTSPDINDIQDQISCGDYTLPTITGSGLSGNQILHILHRT